MGTQFSRIEVGVLSFFTIFEKSRKFVATENPKSSFPHHMLLTTPLGTGQ